MITASLDGIVRDVIMRRGYTFHKYIRFLVYAKNCLRELTFDDLKVYNTIILPTTDYNAVELPSDYQDYVRVAAMSGQKLKPLVETDKLNPLVARTADFSATTYAAAGSDSNTNPTLYTYFYPFYWNTVTWNNFGEFTGRMYGMGAGSQPDVFAVFRERNQIQLSELLSVDSIVLEYISDGMNSDAATRIDPYAIETIAAYIIWQHKEHTRTYSINEAELAKQEYISQRMILRARKSDLTTEVLKRRFQAATYASPKSL